MLRVHTDLLPGAKAMLICPHIQFTEASQISSPSRPQFHSTRSLLAIRHCSSNFKNAALCAHVRLYFIKGPFCAAQRQLDSSYDTEERPDEIGWASAVPALICVRNRLASCTPLHTGVVLSHTETSGHSTQEDPHPVLRTSAVENTELEPLVKTPENRMVACGNVH